MPARNHISPVLRSRGHRAWEKADDLCIPVGGVLALAEVLLFAEDVQAFARRRPGVAAGWSGAVALGSGRTLSNQGRFCPGRPNKSVIQRTHCMDGGALRVLQSPSCGAGFGPGWHPQGSWPQDSGVCVSDSARPRVLGCTSDLADWTCACVVGVVAAAQAT